MVSLRPSLPQRIVCLTEETTETLYALGSDDLIVGISGFTVRPPQARQTKPKISTYLDAKYDDIIALSPDVVLAWSDLQAPLCAELMKRGIEVVGFNHRSIEGILSMILRLGSLVGKYSQAQEYVEMLIKNIELMQSVALQRIEKIGRKPRVYFEEWYDPLISGICWVSEIIELCGGDDIFTENKHFPDAKRRIIADMDEVVRRSPDVMIASWCGKGFKPEKVWKRSGWETIPALTTNDVYEIHSSIILQPGPAALTDGIASVSALLDTWAEKIHS